MKNKDSIEGLGINALSDSLLVTNGILVPDLKQMDKYPSWDGNINIYSNENSSKTDLKQIYVQVKAHAIDYSENKIKKDAETIQEVTQVEDLRNYLHNHGGAVYFSVHIDKDKPLERIVYYDTLTPIKLQEYLKGTNRNGRKTISMKRFPEDNNEKIFILSNFFEDSRKQTSFITQGIIPAENIEDMSEITSITSSVIPYGYPPTLDGVIQAFFKNENYFYATIKGSDALLPINIWGKLQMMSYKNNISVSVNGVECYNAITACQTHKEKHIIIGDSVKIICQEPINNRCATSLQITLSNSLRKRCIDMRFLLDAYIAGSFILDDYPIIFNSPEIKAAYFTAERKKELDMYESIVRTLDTLHVKNDLLIDKVTKQEWKELVNLSQHFDKVENASIKLLRERKCDDSIIYKYLIKIQDITLRIFGKKYDGKTYLYDLINLPHILISGSTSKKTSAIHSILTVDDYKTVSNILYDMMLPAYQYASTMGEIEYAQANLDVLSLLTAYDHTQNKDQLKAAKDITEWLLGEVTIIPKELLDLNLLQIIKRERAFSEIEQAQLASIADTSDSDATKVATYLLMDNMAMSRHYYNKLGIEDKKNMKSWPIYKFWKE